MEPDRVSEDAVTVGTIGGRPKGNSHMETAYATPTTRFLDEQMSARLLDRRPDVMFAIFRNTVPNLVMPGRRPAIVTRFPDVQEVLQRPDIFTVTYAPMMDPSVGPFMLGRDGTEINRRDKAIMTSIMGRGDLPKVRQIVARLADEAVTPQIDKRRIEVVNTVSRVVPMRLVNEYFGLKGVDVGTMMRWSKATQYDMFHNDLYSSPPGRLARFPQIHLDNLAAGAEMRAHLAAWIPRCRERLGETPPPDDILSRLLRTPFPDAIGFDEERIATNIMGTLVGAGETTSQAVAQILEQLFKRPVHLAGAVAAAKADDDALLFNYCWEALRFNPIFPGVFRRCMQDYTIARGTLRSRKIKAGKLVVAAIRSAMRDGREIPAAGTFCIDRPAHHYMHFGYGRHSCLGDQVSQVMVPETVKRLLKLPGLRPAAPIDKRGGPWPEEYVVEFDLPLD